MKAVKKVLFPTDFSIRSLNIVLDYVKNSDALLDITLVHGYENSNSILDMLFESKSKKLGKLQTTEFDESCKLIQNTHHSKINSFQIEILPFSTRRYFNNFVEANQFDSLVCPQGFKAVHTHKNSFDLIPLISKSRYNVEKVDCTPQVSMRVPQHEQVADLFLSNAR